MLQVFENIRLLRTRIPYPRPGACAAGCFVLGMFGAGSSGWPSSYLQNPLGRVAAPRTLRRAIALEVVDDCRPRRPDVPEIQLFTPLAKKQQPVKNLKQLCRRLMNRA